MTTDVACLNVSLCTEIFLAEFARVPVTYKGNGMSGKERKKRGKTGEPVNSRE